MTIRSIRISRLCLALACTNLVVGCAQDKKYEGISVSANNLDKTPYIYSAVGPLDFEGQDPVAKAKKVMLAACPLGQPGLMLAGAPKLQTETSNHAILVALFACNQRIPGVE